MANRSRGPTAFSPYPSFPPHYLVSVALLFSLPLACSSFEVSSSTSEKLVAGEAHYYTIDASGYVFVALISDEGDVDMFLSGSTRTPSAHDYEESSTSCGLDLVVIPANRPVQTVNLGVHAHIHHEVSRYRLYLIQPSKDDILRYQVFYVFLGGCTVPCPLLVQAALPIAPPNH